MLSAAGVSVRHFFNRRHYGEFRHEFLFIGLMLFC